MPSAVPLLLHQLDQSAERALRVNEGNGGPPRARAGGLVDGPPSGGHKGSQRLSAVVDPVADVVDAFTPLFQEGRDGRVGPGPRGELDVGLAHLQEGLVYPVAFHHFAVVDLGTDAAR